MRLLKNSETGVKRGTAECRHFTASHFAVSVGMCNSLGGVYLYSGGAEGPCDGGFGVSVRKRSTTGTATSLGRPCLQWPLPGAPTPHSSESLGP